MLPQDLKLNMSIISLLCPPHHPNPVSFDSCFVLGLGVHSVLVPIEPVDFLCARLQPYTIYVGIPQRHNLSSPIFLRENNYI